MCVSDRITFSLRFSVSFFQLSTTSLYVAQLTVFFVEVMAWGKISILSACHVGLVWLQPGRDELLDL